MDAILSIGNCLLMDIVLRSLRLEFFLNRPIAQIFFIFFLESTFKNKLKSKISEF